MGGDTMAYAEPVRFADRAAFEGDDPRREWTGPGQGPSDDVVVLFAAGWTVHPGTYWQVIFNHETGEVYAYQPQELDAGYYVLGWARSWEVLAAACDATTSGDPLALDQRTDGVDMIISALA